MLPRRSRRRRQGHLSLSQPVKVHNPPAVDLPRVVKRAVQARVEALVPVAQEVPAVLAERVLVQEQERVQQVQALPVQRPGLLR